MTQYVETVQRWIELGGEMSLSMSIDENGQETMAFRRADSGYTPLNHEQVAKLREAMANNVFKASPLKTDIRNAFGDENLRAHGIIFG